MTLSLSHYSSSWKIIAAGLCLFLTTACSKIQWAYKYGDPLVLKQIYTYSDFNTQQREKIKEYWSQYKLLHAQTILPHYVSFCGKVADWALQPQFDKKSGIIRKELADLLRLTFTPLIPPTAAILHSLNAGQIEALEEALQEKNQTRREQSIGKNSAESHKLRIHKIVSQIDFWVPTFEEAQTQELLKKTESIPISAERWIQRREEEHRRLISLLHKKAPTHQIEAELLSWLTENENEHDANSVLGTQGAVLATLLQTLKPTQLTEIRNKLGNLREAFEEIHAEALQKQPVLATNP